jgi:TatD DNase family protein
VVGIGECGLDDFYNRSPQDVQTAVFRTHVAAARETGLPLVVHTRDADAATAAILTEEQRAGAFTGVLHCFSSGAALAQTAVDLGFLISFSGILTFRKSDELRRIARGLPAERLLVETDAPYLAPVPMRGKRNEPGFVRHTLDVLAECRDESPEWLSAATGANFLRLFPKAAG